MKIRHIGYPASYAMGLIFSITFWAAVDGKISFFALFIPVIFYFSTWCAINTKYIKHKLDKWASDFVDWIEPHYED